MTDKEARQTLKFLDTLSQRHVAQLLDQPVIVSAHEQKGEFFSGSEFPTTVVDDNGDKKVGFRFAGTKLEVTPFIKSKEKILLELKAEVSKVAPELSMGDVPGFKVRRINTGLTIKPGSTVTIVADNHDGKELIFLLQPTLVKIQDVDVEKLKPSLR